MKVRLFNECAALRAPPKLVLPQFATKISTRAAKFMKVCRRSQHIFAVELGVPMRDQFNNDSTKLAKYEKYAKLIMIFIIAHTLTIE